jgi:hypothetical protein
MGDVQADQQMDADQPGGAASGDATQLGGGTQRRGVQDGDPPARSRLGNMTAVIGAGASGC